MFRIVITDEATGQVSLDQPADNFVVLSQNGNAFSKSGQPNDLILQLGMLHFAMNQIQAEMSKQSVPVKIINKQEK